MNSPRQAPCSLARRGPRGSSSSSSSSSSSTHGLPPLLLLVSAALALLLPTTAAQSTDAPCFFPNSTAAAADMAPCGGAGADTTHSHCCNQGWACLSNGLCMAAGQDPAQLAGATLMRGACTDQTWTSPDCPRWCTNAEDLDDLNVPQPIAACQAVPGAFYCANSDDAADCDEEEEVIRFSGGAPSAVTTIAADALEANEAAAAASSPTDADGEKGTPSSAGPWSPVSGSSELPTTVSRDVQEAGADSAVFEAPVGHTTAGRAEAPEDPRRFEAPVFQGTQGRHELA
ncbi:hypothetical protein VdG2_01969 [Verticillium dahliae VDG2]|nr:hypothetical protein VdG2_01969 [Verticillium dahliae VDG2]